MGLIHSARKKRLSRRNVTISNADSSNHDFTSNTLTCNETSRRPTLDNPVSPSIQAVDRLPIRNTSHAGSLNRLAMTLHTQYLHTHQRPDIDRAIYLLRKIITWMPENHTHRPPALNNLAAALQTRFEQIDQLPDLDEAISLHRRALSSPEFYPDHSILVVNLGLALTARFRRTCQLADIDEAIQLHRKALVLRPVSHSDHTSSLGNLATVLRIRFGQTGQLPDLEEAISLHRKALAFDSDRSDRLSSLNNLAATLGTYFEHTGHLPDLDEAIFFLRESIAFRPLPHSVNSSALNNLAASLNIRFWQTGRLADLEEAVLLLREALALQPTGHAHHSSLNNLALVLGNLAKHTSQLPYLDEAILLHRQALVLWPAPHSDHSASLNNLATDLQTRFLFFRTQLSDLDEVILLHREALALRPIPHPFRSTSLNNLATALRLRQTGQSSDLDEAVLLHREALTLQPAPHPGRLWSLNSFAMTLQTKFGKTDRLQDLDEAISLHREALALRPALVPAHTILPINLARALQSRFKKTDQLADLDEAIMLCQNALRILPKDDPKICEFSCALGICLMGRWRTTQEDGEDDSVEWQQDVWIDRQLGNLTGAVDAFRSAVHCEAALVSERFTAARLWATLSETFDRFDRESSALEAYEAAIGFLPHMAMLGLDLKSRQEAMSHTDNLACHAAACAILSQKYHKAIELLEAGRAIFWSQALRLRTPMNDLKSVKPELAQRLENISRALEQGALRDMSRTMSDPPEKVMSAEKAVVHYRQLNAEWLAAVEEVRGLDGFHEFLGQKSYATLSAAATKGPVVLLNASNYWSECSALIMRDSQDPVHIPFPEFTFNTAEKLLRKMQASLGSSHPIARGDLDRHAWRAPPSERDPDTVIRDVLATLWRLVVQPIIHSLDLEKTHTPPRLWWLPTGPFASLPIHAAGIYGDDGNDCVTDYVVSSYTPTLTALISPPTPITEPFKVLVAIQPVTNGQSSLPCTEQELRKIEKHVPNKSLVKFGIPEVPASVKTILSEISTASIVHMACHGQQNTENPLESALLLDGDRLKVSQLMELSVPKASLVFLSACQSASANDSMPDEPINLTVTMLFCGFRGAVGTMWSIEDRDGPTVADHFYGQLFSRTLPDTSHAAYALHFAVSKLRAEKCSFVRWVPFIHLGL